VRAEKRKRNASFRRRNSTHLVGHFGPVRERNLVRLDTEVRGESVESSHLWEQDDTRGRKSELRTKRTERRGGRTTHDRQLDKEVREQDHLGTVPLLGSRRDLGLLR